MIEMRAYFVKFFFGFFNYTMAIAMSPLLSLTCFSLLVAHGFNMSVSDAFAAVNILG